MNTLDLLERLIAIPTVSRDSSLDLIRFVEEFLGRHGVACRLILDDTGRKANVYATIGPQDRPGVMLSGHTDVVPVDGQVWSGDPFRLRRADGRLYGRGAADMKGFVACALNAAREAAGRSLATPLHLALSHDEEVGCVGVRRMIDVLEGTGPAGVLHRRRADLDGGCDRPQGEDRAQGGLHRPRGSFGARAARL